MSDIITQLVLEQLEAEAPDDLPPIYRYITQHADEYKDLLRALPLKYFLESTTDHLINMIISVKVGSKYMLKHAIKDGKKGYLYPFIERYKNEIAQVDKLLDIIKRDF